MEARVSQAITPEAREEEVKKKGVLHDRPNQTPTITGIEHG